MEEVFIGSHVEPLLENQRGGNTLFTQFYLESSPTPDPQSCPLPSLGEMPIVIAHLGLADASQLTKPPQLQL